MAEDHTNKKQVLFIQGGGDGGYEADAKLADSLQERLGANYSVRYPRLRVDEAFPDFGWGQQIGKEISAIKGQVILVGHSLGASILLKYLTEHKVEHRIGGVFLISTPFWSGDEEWQKGLQLREDFAKRLPKDVPIFLVLPRVSCFQPIISGCPVKRMLSRYKDLLSIRLLKNRNMCKSPLGLRPSGAAARVVDGILAESTAITRVACAICQSKGNRSVSGCTFDVFVA